jgi:hypothetical protein
LSSSEELDSYMRESVADLLRILHVHKTNITFFITGEFYNQFPDVVEMVHDGGHEIGFHCYTHRPVTSAEILCEEIKHSKKFLDKFKPRGFRAPWIYLPDGLLSILKQNGFVYDSSTFDAPGKGYNHEGMKIFPVSSYVFFNTSALHPIYPKSMNLKMLLREIPFGSGIIFSYFRMLYPYILNHYGRYNKPCIFYLHLWQLYPTPDQEFNIFRDNIRIVHKYSVLKTLTNLLSKYRFQCMEKLLEMRPDNNNNIAHYLTFDLEI